MVRDVPNSFAMALFGLPSDAIRQIRARNTVLCGVLRALTQASKVFVCSSVIGKTSAAFHMPQWYHTTGILSRYNGDTTLAAALDEINQLYFQIPQPRGHDTADVLHYCQAQGRVSLHECQQGLTFDC